MTRYRKKPVVIDAWRVPDSPDDAEYLVGTFLDYPENLHVCLADSLEEGSYGGVEIVTLEGVMTARPGDWVIKGVAGEFYSCRDDIFQATYEFEGPS